MQYNYKTISLSIIIVMLIGYLIYKKIKKNKLRKRVLADGTDDYAATAKNIALSISQSKVLYKKLITKVHPDRFPNDLEKQKRAEEISAMLTEAKRNYSKLVEIEEVIEKELN
jgi:hypothetical protein